MGKAGDSSGASDAHGAGAYGVAGGEGSGWIQRSDLVGFGRISWLGRFGIGEIVLDGPPSPAASPFARKLRRDRSARQAGA
jgi:hypothetical protein